MRKASGYSQVVALGPLAPVSYFRGLRLRKPKHFTCSGYYFGIRVLSTACFVHMLADAKSPQDSSRVLALTGPSWTYDT